MEPGWYAPGRLPKCRVCGARNYREDDHRNKHGRGGKANETCRCYSVFGANGCYPHRKGTGMCEHNAALTEQDHQELQEAYARRRRR